MGFMKAQVSFVDSSADRTTTISPNMETQLDVIPDDWSSEDEDREQTTLDMPTAHGGFITSLDEMEKGDNVTDNCFSDPSVSSLSTIRNSSSEMPHKSDQELDSPSISTSGVIQSRSLSLRDVSIGLYQPLPTGTLSRGGTRGSYKMLAGFFAGVYKGTWKGSPVIVKVLSACANKQLFLRNIQSWSRFDHPSVLKISEPSPDFADYPIFAICPYLKHGNLDAYLRGLENLDRIKPWKMIYEVAKGMEYLHSKDFVHGYLRVSKPSPKVEFSQHAA
jgi:Protein tyrosine and serine/threonine kinase